MIKYGGVFLFLLGSLCCSHDGVNQTAVPYAYSHDFLQYEGELDKSTKHVTLYENFNTVFAAYSTMFTPALVKMYKQRQITSGVYTKYGANEVVEARGDYIVGDFLGPNIITLLLSIYVPRDKAFLAADLLAYWQIAVRILKKGDANNNLSTLYEAKITPLRNVKKVLLSQYFPFVNRWSTEYIIRLVPKQVSQKLQPISDLSIQLSLVSDVGKATFNW